MRPLLPVSLLLAAPLASQYVVAPITSNFVDIVSTGAVALAGGGGGGSLVPLGFDLPFDGVVGSPIDSINACIDGYLTTDLDLNDFTPDCPAPSGITPNGFIAPYWADLDGGAVLYELLGSAPNRTMVVQWEQMATFDDSTASLTFQAQLFEADAAIEFHYETLATPTGAGPVNGEDALIGVENGAATLATTVTCDAGVATVFAGSAYRFERVVPYLDAPDVLSLGQTFQVPGRVDPGAFYAYGWSVSNGPTGPIPALNGVVLDLGPNPRLAGAGVAPPTGLVSSAPVTTPSGFGGLVVYWQLVSIAGLQPISGTQVSNSDFVVLP